MKKRNLLVVLTFFVILFSMNPVSSANADTTDTPGHNLPEYAKKYYNSEGELIGAVVNDPSEFEECMPVNQEDSRNLLHDIRLERSGFELIVYTVEKEGLVIDQRKIPFEELVDQVGSIDKAIEIIEQVPDTKSGSELSSIDKFEPRNGSDPKNELDWITQPHWELKYSEDITHEWTNIGELYSGPMMNVHLSLKMTSGTYSTTTVSGAGMTLGSESTYAKTWITDLYAYNWQTFSIRMMNDYRYEYWEAWIIIPGWIVSSQKIWKCIGIRGGTIELCSPYPDIHRSKVTSDDSVSLEPRQTKYLVYNQMSDKSFKFDVGAKLKRPWTGPIGSVTEFEVPLVSISYITGHYTSTETVYSLTSTANYYHIWDIYEFGCNYGTTGGFVPTFSVYL